MSSHLLYIIDIKFNGLSYVLIKGVIHTFSP